MAKGMKIISFISLFMTICFCLIYKHTYCKIFLSLAITFGTVAFHFCIRLIVGAIFDWFMHNNIDYTKKWFLVNDFEMSFYHKIKLKKWKNFMPTYDADTFDISKHTFEEIVQATCQSELIHEINVIISFIPLFASTIFGSLYIFFITSVLSAMFDLIFVFMQRFNRKRIMDILSKKQ